MGWNMGWNMGWDMGVAHGVEHGVEHGVQHFDMGQQHNSSRRNPHMMDGMGERGQKGSWGGGRGVGLKDRLAGSCSIRH